MYIHKILQPERIINLKKKSNGVIFDSKFRIFLLKSYFTESFRESNQQIEKNEYNTRRDNSSVGEGKACSV